MEEKRFALLIDSDNISARYIKAILEEMTKYGIVTLKRIYGDWTNSMNTSWKNVLLPNAIQPMQQFAYTTGKNATDSYLIIDAMDILHSNTVDGFCLVTSDSDFTRLAARVRESGKMVIGMGEKKTPIAFRAACDKFIYLNYIDSEDEKSTEDTITTVNSPQVKSVLTEKQDDTESEKTPMEDIERTILSILDEKESVGGTVKAGVGEVGSRLSKIYPDFDVRNYGYTKLSTFCENFDSFTVQKSNSSIWISKKDKNKEDVYAMIEHIVKGAGDAGIDLATLGQKVKDQDKNFNVKSFGFSQLKKFIKSLPFLTVIEDNEKNSNLVKINTKRG